MDIKTTIDTRDVSLEATTVADLPPTANIETVPILRLAIQANRALAELKNKADRLPNQNILLSNIVLREAKDSSAIENIVTTSDVLYKADITPESQLDANTKEVRSYNKALWVGMKFIERHPLTTTVFEAVVRNIKSNTAGIRTTPGTVIKNKNTGEIVHVPPQTEREIRDKLYNLERFLYEPEYSEIDALIKLAVLHYQFEAIHPFYDGNGRAGRIVNVLWLVSQGLLDKPVLFLSGYFLRNKDEYYRKLAAVTENQEWESWIIYILNGIIETSNRTCELIDKIIKARELCQQKLQKYFPKIYSFDLVECVFSAPYFRIVDFMNCMPTISGQTASKYLHKLAQPYTDEGGNQKQVLEMFRIGRDNVYFNRDLFDILSGQK